MRDARETCASLSIVLYLCVYVRSGLLQGGLIVLSLSTCIAAVGPQSRGVDVTSAPCVHSPLLSSEVKSIWSAALSASTLSRQTATDKVLFYLRGPQGAD